MLVGLIKVGKENEKITILYVEDSAGLRDALSENLRINAINVTECECPREARKLLARQKFDASLGKSRLSLTVSS